MSVVRINTFRAVAGKEQALYELMQQVQEYILASQGCSSCELLCSQSDGAKLLVIEQWTSEEAHQRSLENYPKEKMMAAMPLLAAPPEGEFYAASCTGGLSADFSAC